MEILSPGTRIGYYEIVSRPMMGGMGIVYFAHVQGFDDYLVALKTFRPELLADLAARDRFLREADTWVALGHHPHIVLCYAVDNIDSIPFLILEAVTKAPNMPDASLRSWLIPGHPAPIEQALLFVLQIARGMQYATEKIPGFVHRDLKPENVLVDAAKFPGTNINRLRVTDFGLAAILKNEIGKMKSEDESQDESQDMQRSQLTHGVVGTPLYMAPEQWKDEEVGAYTDIYALGCILYELVLGQYVVEGRTITQVRDAHYAGKLRSFNKSLPQDVIALLTKCLALNPALRYSNWRELIAEIERVYSIQTGKSVPGELEFGPGEVQGTGPSYNTIGAAYLDIGKDKVAVSYFDKAIKLAHENNDKEGKAKALTNLGEAYSALGEVHRAIECHEQSLTIFREIGDKHLESSVLARLGSAHSELGNTQLTIECFEQSLIIARDIDDLQQVASSAFIGAVAYKKLHDPRALALAREAERIWTQLSNPDSKSAKQLVFELQFGLRDGEQRAAIGEFLHANSALEMQTVVKQYSFMTCDYFIEDTDEFIEKISSAELKQQAKYRLTWLRQIANQK